MLPSMAYNYLSGGAADEVTLRWNTEAFSRLRLRPRVLTFGGKADTRVKLFGTEHSCPVLLAPASYHRLYHPDGELATARGAAAAGVTYVISTATTTPLGDIARAADADRWFQLYLLPHRGLHSGPGSRGRRQRLSSAVSYRGHAGGRRPQSGAAISGPTPRWRHRPVFPPHRR